MTQRRSYYRIRFPVAERPRLTVGAAEYEVHDLSEEGARIGPVDAVPNWSAPASSRMTMADGMEATVSVVLLRKEDDYATIRFTEKLPLPLIIGEQRRLLALYPRETLQ